MRYVVSIVIFLFLAAGMAHAQGFGGMTGGGSTVLVNTPKGLFALRNGVLARYHATTLKMEAELQLLGAAPAPPADMNDRTATQKYFADLRMRQAPAILFAKENSLILVLGDGFARINQETLKPEVATKLAAADAGGDTRTTEPTPGYLLVENTLYLMRGRELLSINIKDGAVLARATLPKELQPMQFNFGGRQGGGRGGNN